MRSRRHLLVAALFVLGACSDNGEPTPSYEGTLGILNRAFIELRHLYVHGGEAYAGATDELGAPLPVDGTLTVAFAQGQRVTVVRQKNDKADEIALTTAEGLAVDADGHTLVVYDEDFVLMEPGAAP